MKLELPEGSLIGLAKEKLPVVVSFVSARPVSFTAQLQFLDEARGGEKLCWWTGALTGG